MVTEALHPDLLENQNRSKPKHGHPTDSGDDGKKEQNGFVHLAELFGESCAQSALQDPINSLIQIEDHCAPAALALPQLEIVPELPDAKLGSKDWYAETLGSGTGSIVPFLLTEAATKRIGGLGTFEAIRKGADSLPLAGKILGLEKHSDFWAHTAKTSLDGAIYGGAFVPVANPDGDFWQQRGRDLLAVSLTFGSQYGISHGILNGIEKSGLGHMHFHDETKLTAKSAAFRMTANLIGGSGAGVIGTEAMSYLYGQGPAQPEMIANAVSSFAITGLALDGAHIAEQKVAAHKKTDAPPP